MEQIYGFPVSQPARAVVWLCKVNNHAFEYKNVNTAKGESRTEAFRSQLNPMGKIPVLKDGEFVLTESHAIMIYLAEKHGWEAWYPKDPIIRARIHEYMNWHHQNARRASEIFFHTLLSKVGRSSPAGEAVLTRKDRIIKDIFRILEHWLRNGNQYLMSESHPTLADMSCYNEVVQLEVMGLLQGCDASFPKVMAWLKRMKSLPLHDEQLAPMMKFFAKSGLLPEAKL